MVIAAGPKIRRVGTDALALIAWAALYAIFLVVDVTTGFGDKMVTDAGFATLMQVLSSIIIALYAAAFGSLFVVTQIVAPSRGQRSVRMLLLERPLRTMVGGTVLVTVIVVLLAGQRTAAPESDEGFLPDEFVNDAAAALSQTVAFLVLAFTVVLARLFHSYSSPTDFRERLIRMAGRRRTRNLEESGKILRQWVCTAARDGASRDVVHACRAAVTLTELYVGTDAGFRMGPPSRRFEPEAGEPSDDLAVMEGWFSSQIGKALIRALEETARADGAWRNMDHLLMTYRRVTETVLRSGFAADTQLLIRGLAEIGCLLEQAESERLTAWFRVRPLETVAQLDAAIHAAEVDKAGTPATTERKVALDALREIDRTCLATWCYLVALVETAPAPAALDGDTRRLADHDDETWRGAGQELHDWSPTPAWSLRSVEPAVAKYRDPTRTG
jgi:hypothetical protein